MPTVAVANVCLEQYLNIGRKFFLFNELSISGLNLNTYFKLYPWGLHEDPSELWKNPLSQKTPIHSWKLPAHPLISVGP